MTVTPDPVWPVVVLAVISFVDGLLCIRPAPFIAACLESVDWPRRWWWVFPPIKLAAALGLVVGIWLPVLGLVTCVALVAYFVLAVLAHVRVGDVGRTLFLNASPMLLICLGVLTWSFLW